MNPILLDTNFILQGKPLYILGKLVMYNIIVVNEKNHYVCSCYNESWI